VAIIFLHAKSHLLERECFQGPLVQLLAQQ
jgi:hypothetical protein